MDRLKSIDIAKGLGILLVVLGHQIDYFHADIPGAYLFIYLFHVPLFFFLSGLFFRDHEDLWTTVKKKFTRLYIPYLLANIFFFFVEMARVWKLGDSYDGDLCWKNLLNAVIGLWPVPSMFSRPTWFILILFRVSILYKLVQLVSGGRKWIMAVLALSMGLAGVLLAPEGCMLGQTLVAISFFSLGHLCGADAISRSKVFELVPSAVLSVILIPVLLFISRHQQTNMAVNVYGNPTLFFVGAVLGGLLVLCISKLAEKLSGTTKALSFVGKHTMQIMIWHIFLIKILFTLAEYVGINGGALLYVVSFLVAVCVPCVASSIVNSMKTKSE